MSRRTRPSTRFVGVLLAGAVGLAACGVHAALTRAVYAEGVAAQAALVRRLGLTDLCLFTEARYTRHPSQADRFSAFQDHPGAFEHFPSGSLMVAPW